MNLALATLFLSVSGCRERAALPLSEVASQADSLAQTVLEANGGRDAWESFRFLAFTFATETDGQRRDIARHVWDRVGGRDRVEFQRGDSTVVTVIDTKSGAGDVFVDGVPADTTDYDEILAEGFWRFIHDTFWLTAPIQMLDSGVERLFLPDSSDAGTAVLRLTFEEPERAPVDTCWVYIELDSGTFMGWTISVEGTRTAWDWLEYRDFEVPDGVVRFGTRKQRRDGAITILTDEIEMPSSVPDSVFTSPNPVLD